jgi:hypothetical protein
MLTVDELDKLGFKVILYSTPALYLIHKTLKRWMQVLHDANDLKVISDASSTFTEFQSFIETSYAGRARHHSKPPGVAHSWAPPGPTQK